LVFPHSDGDEAGAEPAMKAGGVRMDAHDMKRLQKYANNLVDIHLIMDLVPFLAQAYFSQKLPATLSYGQAAILVCLGLQHKTVDDVKAILDLPANQVLALFNKSVRKMHGLLRATEEAAVERSLPKVVPVHMLPHAQDLDDDLAEAADEVKAKIRETLAGQLDEYAIEAGDDDLAEALGNKVPGTGVVSLKSSKPARAKPQTPGKDKTSKKQRRSEGKNSASKGKKHRQR
jgi:N-acetyltransferase 10